MNGPRAEWAFGQQLPPEGRETANHPVESWQIPRQDSDIGVAAALFESRPCLLCESLEFHFIIPFGNESRRSCGARMKFRQAGKQFLARCKAAPRPGGGPANRLDQKEDASGTSFLNRHKPRGQVLAVCGH